jgi:protein CpxP
MNKKLVTIALSITMVLSAVAQNGERGNRGFGGGQRKTIAERVADVHAKFDSTFHFAADKQAKIDSAFVEQYRAQEKMMQDARANFTPGQQPDPSVMQAAREKIQELAIDRDEKLQGILTETEYKKWKDELEPAMRPKRGEGRGQGNRDGGEKKPEGQK